MRKRPSFGASILILSIAQAAILAALWGLGLTESLFLGAWLCKPLFLAFGVVLMGIGTWRTLGPGWKLQFSLKSLLLFVTASAVFAALWRYELVNAVIDILFLAVINLGPPLLGVGAVLVGISMWRPVRTKSLRRLPDRLELKGDAPPRNS